MTSSVVDRRAKLLAALQQLDIPAQFKSSRDNRDAENEFRKLYVSPVDAGVTT